MSASTARLGIVGAGQLGLYLCKAARKLGVTTTVFARHHHDPAISGADHAVIGSLEDPACIAEFIDACDFCTFEFEDVPPAALEQLQAADADGRIKVQPGVDVLRLLQDKGEQKTWLEANDIPTLPFRLLSGDAGADAAAVSEVGYPLIQKSRCGGYDGRGVQLVERQQDAHRLWDAPSVIEPYLAERREIAVLCARNPAGDVVVYPPIKLDFDAQDHVLHLASTMNPQSSTAVAATDLARRLMDRLGGVGLFAIECFVTQIGEIIVNEISPRVHNSGHLTMDACNICQFEQHIRAVMDMPLIDAISTRPAAMVNILADARVAACCPASPTTGPADNAKIYWYGKKAHPRRRKVGHITAVADNVGRAACLAEDALAALRNTRKHQAA